ncbi:BTB/POZ domain-containing protein 6-A isoform X5 [Zeugodacus cucurbitae]|uniref:BTB/POZ domain-containing protein 6-A isoform X5 n=1 Tax=Zeugodacus cucurbitae TaxID=28588 RepID=UPI0023D959A4|nr:BTB/POZ domain-containing protein 6-A isoform X5 [Zeugodacus cucurbitae]
MMNSIFLPSYSQPVPPPPQTKSVQLAHQLMDNAAMAAQFSRRFEQLLRSEKFYDCVFHIAGAQLKCHKLILSTASPVFEAMFYGPLREQQQEIEILDISAETFQLLLNYIYAGVIDFEALTLEEAIELYYCAEKYLVTDLTTSCLLAIARKLRYNNILPALELCVCMDLRDLLNVCMSFFSRCCINNPQYMTTHKNHYVHVSKDCIKAIIAANKSEKTSKQLLWFVYEWCQRECHELGLQQEDCALIINDLQLPVSGVECEDHALKSSQQHKQQCHAIERSYYKACRPFIVDQDTHEWVVYVKCNRFIALRGLVICSRLTPNISPLAHYAFNIPSEYCENLQIEIIAPAVNANEQRLEQSGSGGGSDGEGEGDESDQEPNAANNMETVLWQHFVTKQLTRYNCDMNIEWGDGLLLTPDIEYKIRLLWRTDAYGSEYPCSLQSDFVDGIRFRDVPTQTGSIVKGLRFTNLV